MQLTVTATITVAVIVAGEPLVTQVRCPSTSSWLLTAGGYLEMMDCLCQRRVNRHYLSQHSLFSDGILLTTAAIDGWSVG